ncbi:hypothetical protein Q0Y04_19260 [Clostridioides difficile]|nr:hypothetical protein Q0Y04_19260 [Clostridioides difficile]
MNYNFNEIVDRSNNFSSKWSEMEKSMELMIYFLCGWLTWILRLHLV